MNLPSVLLVTSLKNLPNQLEATSFHQAEAHLGPVRHEGGPSIFPDKQTRRGKLR